MNDDKRREQVAYLHGRIDQQIETWAERFGWNSVELGTHLGAILIGTSTDLLPGAGMPPSATGTERPALAQVEVAGRSHVGRTPGKRGRPSTGKTAKNKMTPIQKYWAQFTPEQRAKMMKARLKKWSPSAKKAWGVGYKKTGKKKRDLGKQRIYNQRSRAKAHGRTPPPLPKGERAVA